MSWPRAWTNTLSNACPFPFDLIRKLMIVYWEFGNDSKSGYLSASCVHNHGSGAVRTASVQPLDLSGRSSLCFSGIFIQLSSPKESFNV